jgi:hypothetical protein
MNPPVTPAGFSLPGSGECPVTGQITAEYDGKGTIRFIVASRNLAGEAGQRIMRESLRAAGLKTRTQVRRALKEQTGAKRAGAINSRTRSYVHEGGLAFSIEGSGKGLPISEFRIRASRSKKVAGRWSPREHWRLQPRDGSGRFGKLVDPGTGGDVSASPWNVGRVFKRSFVHPTRGPVMVRSTGKKQLRRLFGPSIAKEIVQGQSLSTFQAVGVRELATDLPRRMARLLD